MVNILGRVPFRSRGRRRTVAFRRPAFDAAGTWIGTVNGGGAVFDIDGVQIGVVWPHGEIVDYHGTRIGHV